MQIQDHKNVKITWWNVIYHKMRCFHVIFEQWDGYNKKLSRDFCQWSVRVNFCNFYNVENISLKNIMSNQLCSNFTCKNVVFTKYFAKKIFICTMLKTWSLIIIQKCSFSIQKFSTQTKDYSYTTLHIFALLVYIFPR